MASSPPRDNRLILQVKDEVAGWDLTSSLGFLFAGAIIMDSVSPTLINLLRARGFGEISVPVRGTLFLIASVIRLDSLRESSWR